MLSAYLLVAHGSRHPRPQQSVEQLAHLIREQKLEKKAPSSSLSSERVGLLQRTQFPLVGTAALELTPIPLHETIYQFATRIQSVGLKKLQIIPLFLLPGVHVKEDIPAEVTQAQKKLGNDLKLHLQPHLGSYSGITALLAEEFDSIPASARILLSHGSRRPGANLPIEKMAHSLNATPAYWSVSPSLPEQVETLVSAGHEKVAIVPYFLFSGGITEAIAQQVQQLQYKFPQVQLVLGEPLGATSQLANLILNEIAL